MNIFKHYDDLSVTYKSDLFSDFEYCNNYDMLASFLEISSYNKLTQ